MAMQPVGQPCFVKGQGYTDASSKSPLETSSGQDNSSAQRRANRPAGESPMRANRQKSTEAILRCSVIAGRLSKSRATVFGVKRSFWLAAMVGCREPWR